MSAINVVYVGGNLVRDPELKNVGAKGASVVNFSVAVTAQIKKDDPPQSTFFNCEAWGELAKSIAENFKKGNEIFAVGAFRTEKYEKDGVERTAYKVRVNRVGRDLGDIFLEPAAPSVKNDVEEKVDAVVESTSEPENTESDKPKKKAPF